MEPKKEKISREVFLLAVLTSITVFTWIALDVYRAYFKKEVPEIGEIQLESLDPKLDLQVIENLKGRKLFTFEEVALPNILPRETETVTPEATPGSGETSEGGI